MGKGDLEFRKEIEEYYLPRQLVEAILEKGEIPRSQEQCLVGIGFADIADYTWLAKFLSPSENQIILDGLFTAFNIVLQKRGAYLNKIEGDSVMFQFGGPIDAQVKDLDYLEQRKVIASNLFHTCVELQRVCVLFNEANESFLKVARDHEAVSAMKKAFEIIRFMRTNMFIAQSINALFQIKVRIGASFGDVIIGNFGPKGSKHWDVVGLPVIQAKRMETTSPVGGFRVSEELYEVLEEAGIAKNYHDLFVREAGSHSGVYSAIQYKELFRRSMVTIKEKQNAVFQSYSVQVDPLLPERIARQTGLLLSKGSDGIERIVNFIQYYRGNRYVIDSIEAQFLKRGINVKKGKLLKMLDSVTWRNILSASSGDPEEADRRVGAEYSLHRLLRRLGDIQDVVKDDPRQNETPSSFTNQEEYLASSLGLAKKGFLTRNKYVRRRTWFYNYLYPMTFAILRSAMLEYQSRVQELE